MNDDLLNVSLIQREQLVTREPFVSLFPIDPGVVEKLAEDMRGKWGFSHASPIRAWAVGGALVVIDGHMRLQAAARVGLDRVPVAIMDFDTLEEALTWAFQEQAERRRNLTDIERRQYWLRAVALLPPPEMGRGDKVPSGRDFRSAEEISRLIGAAASTVENIRAILPHPEIKADVLNGKISIKEGAKRARKKKEEQQRAAARLTPRATPPGDVPFTEAVFDQLAALDATDRMPLNLPDIHLAHGVRRLIASAPDRVAEIRAEIARSPEVVRALLRALGHSSDPRGTSIWVHLEALSGAAFVGLYRLTRGVYNPSRLAVIYGLPVPWLQALGERQDLQTLEALISPNGDINFTLIIPTLQPGLLGAVQSLNRADQVEVVALLRTIRPADQEDFLTRWSQGSIEAKAQATRWAHLPDYQRPLLHKDTEAVVIWKMLGFWHRDPNRTRNSKGYGILLQRMAGEVYGDAGPAWRRWYDVLWAYGAAIERGDDLGTLDQPPWLTAEDA